MRVLWRFIVSAIGAILILFASEIAVELLAYRPNWPLALILAIALSAPFMSRIWRRDMFAWLAGASALVGFLAFWMGAAAGARAPFTDGQWRLLGWASLVIAALAYGRHRRSATV